MDKQRVKGAIDEAVGSTKQKFGELTGNTGTQVSGAAQKVKGKIETAVGKVKDAARDAHDNAVEQGRIAQEQESGRREGETSVVGNQNRR